jgi:hypothetical protein
MPLGLLNLDENYFVNIKNRKESPKSVYFDDQFSALDTYINTEMLPYLNTLIDGRIPGTDNFASIGKFLRFSPQYDDDDNLITNWLWDVVNREDFDDYSIPYSKLSNLPAGSILAGNADLVFEPLTPTEDYQVLIYGDYHEEKPPIWRKLRGSDLLDRIITGEMIAPRSVPAEAFVEGIIKTELTTDSITTPKFPDRAVTAPKIADGAIDDTVMGAAFADNFINAIGANFIPPNSIDLSQIPQDRLPGLRFFQNNNNIQNARIYANQPWEARVFRPLTDCSLIAPKSITADKIDDQIIPANCLQFYVTNEIAHPGIESLIEYGAIEVEHLDADLRAYLHL